MSKLREYVNANTPLLDAWIEKQADLHELIKSRQVSDADSIAEIVPNYQELRDELDKAQAALLKLRQSTAENAGSDKSSAGSAVIEYAFQDIELKRQLAGRQLLKHNIDEQN